MEGASGLGNGGIGVLPWKGSSVLLFQLANQRAPEEEHDRKRPWPHRPARATEENTSARVDASQDKGEAASGKSQAR